MKNLQNLIFLETLNILILMFILEFKSSMSIYEMILHVRFSASGKESR